MTEKLPLLVAYNYWTNLEVKRSKSQELQEVLNKENNQHNIFLRKKTAHCIYISLWIKRWLLFVV